MANRKFYFRCQYQKGEICISEVIENDEDIPIEDILVALSRLPIKVAKEVNRKAGEKAALQVLEIHNYLIKTVEERKSGTGNSKSYYTDSKSKRRKNRTERIDIECYGEYGLIRETYPMVTKYIEIYRKIQNWISTTKKDG